MSRARFAFEMHAAAIGTRFGHNLDAQFTLGLGLAALSLLLFGADVWREAVHAQLQVGGASLHYAGGLVAQAVWSELALLIGAIAALWLGWSGRAAVGDRQRARAPAPEVIMSARSLFVVMFAVVAGCSSSWQPWRRRCSRHHRMTPHASARCFSRVCSRHSCWRQPLRTSR